MVQKNNMELKMIILEWQLESCQFQFWIIARTRKSLMHMGITIESIQNQLHENIYCKHCCTNEGHKIININNYVEQIGQHSSGSVKVSSQSFNSGHLMIVHNICPFLQWHFVQLSSDQ